MSILERYRSRLYRRSRSSRVVEVYENALKLFLDHKDLTAEDFADKIKSGNLDVVQELNLWLDHLNEKNLAPSTMKNYFYAVKKFVEVAAPNTQVNWGLVDLPKVWHVEEDRIPTKKELRSLLNYADLTDRVITLFAASSGVREATLAGLKVGDVDFESYKDVAVVRVKPEVAKGKTGYVTFITPEAKTVLQQYLDLRKRRGEKLDDNRPLLVSQRTKQHFTPGAIRVRWNRLLKRAAKTERKRTYYVLHFHTLRKFFRTNLELAGVSKAFTERLLGHKPYLDEAYFKPQIDMLAMQYRKAIPYLTIVEQAAEYEELRKRQLIDTARLLGFTEEKLRMLQEVLARAKNMDQAIEEFRKLQEDPQNNNHSKYKVVHGDDALLGYLHAGWELVKELNHDKYLLKK